MKTITHILFGILLLSSITIAQTINGNIEGCVLDSTGQPIPETNISVSGPNLIGTRGSATNDDGFFRILALPSGPYTARIEHVSYQPQIITGIRVPLGATVSLTDIRLQQRILEADEVIVLAEHPALDATSTSLGENLTPAQLDQLPLDRSYQSIIKLLPQVNESYFGDGVSFMGTTGLENKYFINGVDVTNPYSGYPSTSLPYNFIREINVRSGAYEAEYRGSLGGLVNIVTDAGGDDFSGQAYGFFTNNNFASRRYSTEAITTNYSQYDIGGSISGPILRKRLWFFAAYNPNVSSEDVPVKGLGTFNEYQTTHIFASKLTWKINDQNDLQITVFGDPTTGRSVYANYIFQVLNTDPILYNIEAGTYNLIMSGTHVISRNFLLESYASWSRVKNKGQSEGTEHLDELFYWDELTQTISGGPSDAWDNTSIGFAMGMKSTLSLKDHTMKAGLEYWTLSHSIESWYRVLFRPAENLYYLDAEQWSGAFDQTIMGIYLQDSWQFSSRLRLNAGLRWDPQFLYDSNGRMAQKFLNPVSPRFGMVYLLDKIGTQKVTLSAGRFYQILSMSVQKWYYLENTTYQLFQWDHDPRLDPIGSSTIVDWKGTIQPEIAGMKGQHHDEITLGYEGELFWGLHLGIRGIYRSLREAIEDGYDETTENLVLGNPGSPHMQDWPKAKREYSALEFTVEQFGTSRFNFLVTYVLSRSHGNYPGLIDPWWGGGANSGVQFDRVEFLNNATGLLPNDRTHVFKLFGSYRSIFGVTIGASLVWESGVPLTEYGSSELGSPQIFLSPRGTQGRTPDLWDLSIRSVIDFNRYFRLPIQTHLIVDAFHVGSPRTAVEYDQIHYYAVDESGNQINPNPRYGQPIQFQPGMSGRVGMEVSF